MDPRCRALFCDRGLNRAVARLYLISEGVGIERAFGKK
jgi:hypothetical protein